MSEPKASEPCRFGSTAVAVAAVALVVVAGCGAKNNDRIPAAASLTIDTATTLAPTSTAAGGTGAGVGSGAPAIGSVSGGGEGDGTLHGVGEAVPTANGNTVKLTGVDVAGAGPGRYAVNVEVCTNNAARVAPSQYTLELGNASTAAPVTDGKQPALAVSDVSPGACATGWVTFQVPPGQSAVALVFRGSSVIRWSLA